MRLAERKIGAILRRHGYKLTAQRRVVIQAILLAQDHLTPAAIHEKVRQSHPGIGFATVYRTLEILARLELICELHAGGSCRSYAISSSGHHHHLICSNCGMVVDFPEFEFELEEAERNLSKETGFRIDAHLLEFIGLCQVCREKQRKTNS